MVVIIIFNIIYSLIEYNLYNIFRINSQICHEFNLVNILKVIFLKVQNLFDILYIIVSWKYMDMSY